MPSVKSRPKPTVRKRDLSEATPVQAAVLGDVITGMAWTHIHDKYGIAVGTIERWLKEFGIPKPPAQIGKHTVLPSSNKVALHRKRPIGEAVEVPFPSYQNIDPGTGKTKDLRLQLVDYIENSLKALNSQLLVGADPRWISQQSGSDLAAYHRVIGDRFERLLSAFAAGQQPEEEFDDDEDGDEMVTLAPSNVSER